jgi:hypothetical protein
MGVPAQGGQGVACTSFADDLGLAMWTSSKFKVDQFKVQ